LVGLILRKYI